MNILPRVFQILQLFQEAESGFYDQPREMVRLSIPIPIFVMPSRRRFIAWLDLHGLRRYVARLVDIETPGSFRAMGITVPLIQYQFTFPRTLLQDVRYLGHTLTFLLMDEYPEYAWFVRASASRPHMDIEFFSHDPKLGSSDRDSLSGPRSADFWNNRE